MDCRGKEGKVDLVVNFFVTTTFLKSVSRLFGCVTLNPFPLPLLGKCVSKPKAS